jgi:hypothetical protein
MRQGFSSISIGQHEHPHDQRYSDLLWQEHLATVEWLDAGLEIRLIVGRRPVFSSDLTTDTPQNRLLAERLQRRCRRLDEYLANALSRATPPRLLIAVSPASHFADLCINDEVALRGVRSDSASGYELTTIEVDQGATSTFCQEFDQEFAEITGISLASRLADPQIHALIATARVELAKSLVLLENWLEPS